MLAGLRLLTKKPFPTNPKPKENTSNSPEVEDNMVMFGCVLSLKNVERVLNSLTPSRAELFRKNLLLRLKKELRKLWTKACLPDFPLWTCRLLCMTVLITMLTHLKSLSKLPEQWPCRKL